MFSHPVFPLAGDETYQDIFQDFTHMASNDPDKLNRYQQYDPQRPWQNRNSVHQRSWTVSAQIMRDRRRSLERHRPFVLHRHGALKAGWCSWTRHHVWCGPKPFHQIVFIWLAAVKTTDISFKWRETSCVQETSLIVCAVLPSRTYGNKLMVQCRKLWKGFWSHKNSNDHWTQSECKVAFKAVSYFNVLCLTFWLNFFFNILRSVLYQTLKKTKLF